MAKKKDKTEDRIVAVEGALSKTEQFIENNQRKITIIVAIIAVVVLGFYGVKKLYIAPREADAQIQIYPAQTFFEQDSVDKAMYGDVQNNHMGFIDIIDEYKFTKTANLARYYLGCCYLKKGEYENALDELKKFRKRGQLVGPMATANIGSAYMELGETEKALDYYLKAADMDKNMLTAPVYLEFAAQAYEQLGEYEKAIEMYQKIKTDFYKSFRGGREPELDEIEKHISRNKSLQDRS